jgi:hypothetical protein
MKIPIKSRFDERVLYECEAESMPEVLQNAGKVGANLRGANLSDADLSDADLRGADLSDADLSGANLRGANLSDADLSGADLRGADLSDADLSDADLSGADLSCADLRDADLRGADLLIYQTDIWTCHIQPDNIRIGCEYHSVTEWFSHDDERISKMESRALDWWKRHKAAIQAIHATLNAKGTG